MKKLTLAALLAFTAANAGASGFPVTVDNCGQPLTFERPPQRAIIQDINMSQMAFALQLQPSIVGVTGISGWYKNIPEFTQQQGTIPELAAKYPTIENLLAASPDLFFAGWNYGLRGEVTPQALAKFNIKTLVLSESCIHVDNHRPRASMDLLYDDMIRLGKVFGKQEQAEKLVAGWQRQVADIHRKIATQKPVRVFLYDSGEEKPYTSGAYAMPTAIIEAAGATNVMDTLNTSWVNTNWESVAATEPEFIILVDYQAEPTDSIDARQLFLEQHPLMKQTPAVVHHRYLKLKYQALTPGPVNIEAIHKLAQALYPAAVS
ncbi:ABC transporter substrate-binding protein [Serratia liquefaciens]|uniref:ABC transporter substrate-binding protein n=1 Tax=Serratia liquefaciens TaxID=614 RepID=UPI0011F36472|nr:ABC transporter substrate-binding protein [Serratia liquefaciens]QIC85295.1 ABC transporter substrate-binding protein [Serratia liquefaciens]CAI2501655.1 corrinoid ABC transporter substrate-binding protein [Serratia liquefaciens]